MPLPNLLLLSCMFLSYVPRLTLSQDIPTFTPSSAILFPGQQVIFMCNTTATAFVWTINNDNFFSNQLRPENGVFAIDKTLFINMSMNATLYGCGSVIGNIVTSSEKSIVFVAAAPNQVPDVAVDVNSITLNNDNVTLTLSWREPFNNFDPIMNYTVSCSGDVTCPPNFTTTDNTKRSYTITNLTPMTNYTFSVVATNSIGSGEAGVAMITTPPEVCSITNISGNVTHDQERKKTKFYFTSDGASGVKYKCKLDNGSFNDCKSPVTWRNLNRGRHAVVVKAFCIDDKGKKSCFKREKFIFRLPLHADVPAIVSNVTATVDNNIVNCKETVITLSWRETFNNFDPIVNYTVSCSGDDKCPSIYTTTDNNTRSYTINNLTPMTNYTFSVVATNSIGSGEAGVVMITTPPEVCSIANIICEDVTHDQERKKTNFYFTSDGASRVKYKCKLNDGKFTNCKSPVTWKNLNRGRHAVVVKAFCIDDKGKKSCFKTKKFRFRLPLRAGN